MPVTHSDSQNLNDMEPPLGEGLVRLYRVGILPNESRLYGMTDTSPEFSQLKWWQQAAIEAGSSRATGRWFTQRRSDLEFYEQNNSGDPLYYLDVSKVQAESWRVANNPEAKRHSADHHNEFFLPIDVANQAQRMPGYVPPYDKSGQPLAPQAQPALGAGQIKPAAVPA